MLGVSPDVVARDPVVRRSRVGPDPVTAVASALVAPNPVGVAVRETDPVERAVAHSVVGDEDSCRPGSGQEDAVAGAVGAEAVVPDVVVMDERSCGERAEDAVAGVVHDPVEGDHVARARGAEQPAPEQDARVHVPERPVVVDTVVARSASDADSAPDRLRVVDDTLWWMLFASEPPMTTIPSWSQA